MQNLAFQKAFQLFFKDSAKQTNYRTFQQPEKVDMNEMNEINSSSNINSEKLNNNEKNQDINTKFSEEIIPSVDNMKKETQNGTLNQFYLDKNLHQSEKSYKQDLTKSLEFLNKNNSNNKAWNPETTKVPATALSRFGNQATLGIKMLGGAIMESSRKGLSMSSNDRSSLMSDYNLESLSKTLRKMRGVALKLGQFISMQDERDMVSAELIRALESARQHADIMPHSQLDSVMNGELGVGWQEKYFSSFDKKPFASASIGQVHMGVLKDGTTVAVKVQFPGVAESIDSDLNTLKRFLIFGNFLPKGLFIEDLILGIRNELKNECDYKHEASSQTKVRNLLKNDDRYEVPEVIEHLSSTKVLTTKQEEGFFFDDIKNISIPQKIRNRIGQDLLELCLKEIFEMRIMQSDPNPANFKFQFTKDPKTNELSFKIILLDFGSTLEISEDFRSKQFDIVLTAVFRDTERCQEASKTIGFLTGQERKEMIDSWCIAMQHVGEPFSLRQQDEMKIKSQNFTKSTTTQQVSNKGKVWANHRLRAPPKEIQTLHRKLAGSFLFNINLNSDINCIEMQKKLYTDSIKMYGDTHFSKELKL